MHYSFFLKKSDAHYVYYFIISIFFSLSYRSGSGEHFNFKIKFTNEIDQPLNQGNIFSCDRKKEDLTFDYDSKDKKCTNFDGCNSVVENSILINCDKILHDRNDDGTNNCDNDEDDEFLDAVENELTEENVNTICNIDYSQLKNISTEDNNEIETINRLSGADYKNNISDLKYLNSNEKEIKNIENLNDSCDKLNYNDNCDNVKKVSNENMVDSSSINMNTPCCEQKQTLSIKPNNTCPLVQEINDKEQLKKNNINNNLSKDITKNDDKSKKSKIKKSKVTNDISPMLAAVLRTEQCIREWVSIDTLYFLLGEDKLKELIEQTCGLDKFQKIIQQCSTMQDPLIYERYLAICKKLNLLELNESKYDKNVKSEICGSAVIGPQQPVPDFEKLKKETKEMEIKVKSFYRGDKQVQFNETDTGGKVDNEFVVIPLVDQHAQKALRRRIVLDHLNRVYVL